MWTLNKTFEVVIVLDDKVIGIFVYLKKGEIKIRAAVGGTCTCFKMVLLHVVCALTIHWCTYYCKQTRCFVLYGIVFQLNRYIFRPKDIIINLSNIYVFLFAEYIKFPPYVVLMKDKCSF